MPANKSSGPDGLTWEFFRSCWAIVKPDVLAAVRAVFLGHDQFFGKLNVAFITLLPKKEGAVDLKEFRPISLVHSFAKLIAKLLALCLAPRAENTGARGLQPERLHSWQVHPR
jgi:mannosylglycoprotein endo-beta-mannosidase